MEKIFRISNVDYIVSTEGKIFSTKKFTNRGHHKEIKQRKNKDGYMEVTVGESNNRKTRRVHRIIAMAFIPNPDSLPEVDHIDNDKTNNNVENLRWISGFDNKSRIPFETRSNAQKHEKNGNAKLTVEKVKKIRKLWAEGVTKYKLAKMFNVGWTTISHIIKNETWRGV